MFLVALLSSQNVHVAYWARTPRRAVGQSKYLWIDIYIGLVGSKVVYALVVHLNQSCAAPHGHVHTGNIIPADHHHQTALIGLYCVLRLGFTL